MRGLVHLPVAKNLSNGNWFSGVGSLRNHRIPTPDSSAELTFNEPLRKAIPDCADTLTRRFCFPP